MKKVDLTIVQNENEPNIAECPCCGHDEYYVKIRYSGTGIYRLRFDRSDSNNSDMHECLSGKTIGKFTYCLKCNKRIFRIKE